MRTDPMRLDELHTILARTTVDVPTAGRAFGLSRNGSYEAARRGDLPVIRVGRLLRVSTAVLAERLGHTVWTATADLSAQRGAQRDA